MQIHDVATAAGIFLVVLLIGRYRNKKFSPQVVAALYVTTISLTGKLVLLIPFCQGFSWWQRIIMYAALAGILAELFIHIGLPLLEDW